MIHTGCILKPGKDGAICVESDAQVASKPKLRAQVELRVVVDLNSTKATSSHPCVVRTMCDMGVCLSITST